MSWQTIIIILLVLIFFIAYVPLVPTLFLQVCITQDGKIQNIMAQSIKVPILTAYSTQQKVTTSYFISVTGLPESLNKYATVGCNNLYWYNAKSGTYRITVNVKMYTTTWINTDTRTSEVTFVGD
jgi:hypothetical protein